MISVDKPMPKNCTECPMMYDYIYCNAAEEGFCEKNFDICEADHRPNWCPLIESGPHIMRLSDIHSHMALWIEDRQQNRIVLCIGGSSAEETKNFITEYDESIWRRDSAYNVTWRAWTDKPTNEQREAAAWDEDQR